MGFSSIFIRRPIATSLLMAAVLLLGILGYKALPVSALPASSPHCRKAFPWCA